MAAPSSFTLGRFFQALGDRTRLRLLNLMGGQELCVCYFVEVLGLPQPKISRHLAYLRRAGLVAARREGKWMHYRLVTPADAAAARILRETLAQLTTDKVMQKDRMLLTKACCVLEGAPLPVVIDGAGRGDLLHDHPGR